MAPQSFTGKFTADKVDAAQSKLVTILLDLVRASQLGPKQLAQTGEREARGGDDRDVITIETAGKAANVWWATNWSTLFGLMLSTVPDRVGATGNDPASPRRT